MSKHTPGPWFVGAQNDLLYVIDRRPCSSNDYPQHDADAAAVAKVYCGNSSEANARLIAAAPESHEANKLSLTVLCAIRAAGVLSHDTNILRDLDSAIGANRSAIAKATGEQP